LRALNEQRDNKVGVYKQKVDPQNDLASVVAKGRTVREMGVVRYLRRHDRGPCHHPVPGGEVLVAGVDDQGVRQGPGQFGQDAAQHEGLPVLGLKHLHGILLSSINPIRCGLIRTVACKSCNTSEHLLF